MIFKQHLIPLNETANNMVLNGSGQHLAYTNIIYHILIKVCSTFSHLFFVSTMIDQVLLEHAVLSLSVLPQ